MSVSSSVHKSGSLLTRIIGLVIALIITGVGVIVGLVQGQPIQQVILFAVVTLAGSAWAWQYFVTQFDGQGQDDGETQGPGELYQAWLKYRLGVLGFAVLALLFLILSLTVEGFFNVWNVISAIILLVIIVLTMTVGKFVAENKSAFIGLMVLIGLFSIGAMNIEGFSSTNNIKSMLLFASFLGLACVGQTLVALVGGLDLSIPFVIGSANVGMLYLISLGVPPWLALVITLIVGSIIGLINGVLSYRLQGQALIMTLGTGFAVSGGIQIITSIGSAYGGNVFAAVPSWLSNLAALNGSFLGLPFPPVIAIWLGIAVVLIVGMKNTVYGRYLYALGVNRTSAKRVSISERVYWISVYTLSGFFSALTGILLLGWSGGGFIGVGDSYLFMTLAAVVVGGTSLLGGIGGYGFTVIGVLVLQVLTSFLVGIGLNHEWQQFIFGLLILPMVALYARSPHIRTQI
ncbi:MAG: ABC transporter permease [Roseovarius sp.]|nr:ABC transporter permease [Roseovarius sp.]